MVVHLLAIANDAALKMVEHATSSSICFHFFQIYFQSGIAGTNGDSAFDAFEDVLMFPVVYRNSCTILQQWPRIPISLDPAPRLVISVVF